MITIVEPVLVFPPASFTVQVIVDTPPLNEPLALLLLPVLQVAPVILYDMETTPQLSVAVNTGIV